MSTAVSGDLMEIVLKCPLSAESKYCSSSFKGICKHKEVSFNHLDCRAGFVYACVMHFSYCFSANTQSPPRDYGIGTFIIIFHNV